MSMTLPPFLFPPLIPPSVRLAGSELRVPVRRIFCVGRNYRDHSAEIGAASDEPPVFFTKPADALVGPDAEIPYPSNTMDFQPEVELVVSIVKGGSEIAASDVGNHVLAYGVGNDLTRRDRQNEARRSGLPWDVAKAFDRSAQVGLLFREFNGLNDARIWLTVDGKVRQNSTLGQMIWPVGQIISILSRSFELIPGDLIFTGTPGGVGPVRPGQTIVAGIDGLNSITLRVAD